MTRTRTRLAFVAFAAALAWQATSCYDTPRPKCAFLCTDTCPDGYTCGNDGRCHLFENGVPAQCEDSLIDASTLDADLTPDAPLPDAGIDAASPPDASIDAMDQAFTGTIAVIDIKVTNDLTGIGIAGLRGAAVSVSYSDPDTGTGVLTGSLDIGQCSALVYTVDNVANPFDNEPVRVNEGAVTITGTASTIAPCGFNGTLGSYLCPADSGAIPVGATVVNNANGTSTYTITGENFVSGMVGMNASFTGLDAANNGAFGIVAVPTAETLVVANASATAQTTAAAGPTFVVISGGGPTVAQVPFLTDNVSVAVSKVAGTMTGAFNVNVLSAGFGLALATASTKPHMVPTTAVAWSVDCGGAGGSCGTGGGAIKGLVLTGSTTDTSVSGLPPFIMPKPTTSYATFTCTGIGATSLTMPQAVWAAVLSTTPTRIETRVLRPTADLSQSPNRVLVGHGLIGWTTVP